MQREDPVTLIVRTKLPEAQSMCGLKTIRIVLADIRIKAWGPIFKGTIFLHTEFAGLTTTILLLLFNH